MDKEKHVIVTKVIPELINGILSGLRDKSSSLDDVADDDEDRLSQARSLRVMRPHFGYIVDAHRTKISKVNEDAFNELIEMITSAILTILSDGISKVWLLKRKPNREKSLLNDEKLVGWHAILGMKWDID